MPRTLLFACLAAAAAVASGCKIERLPPSGPSFDDFNRAAIGNDWNITGGNWRIVDGALVIDHAYNHPAWLRKPIPEEALVEFDCWSNDPNGDLKVEAWGDGKSFAQTTSYTATSYVFILGGWHNQISAIARMNEHGNDRRTRSDTKVVPGKKYHWRLVRHGGRIDWQVDGLPFLSFDDKSPLEGAEHAYFGFNDWEAELHFDNLKVTPL
jgi:hypothetical protein